MFYRYELKVPRDTPANNPVSLDMRLGAGVIHLVRVKFPSGCHGRVYAAIFQGASKLWPTERGTWFQGDDETIEFREHAVTKAGYHWKVKAFSPDTGFPHTIHVRIGVLAEEEISPFTIVKDLVAVFKRMLGLK